jgi:hypothetical protein
VTEPRSRPIVERESLLPWLAASLVAMSGYIVGLLVGTRASDNHRLVFSLALCSVVTATELVIHRSRRVVEDADRTQRARPAAQELDAWASEQTLLRLDTEADVPPYAVGMLRYSAAVVELLEHSVAVALRDGVDPVELVSGRDDAAALHDLLGTMTEEPVHLQRAAKVHTICSLWEADQGRLEHLAADFDPDFHLRWRARHLADLRLRHGERPRRNDVALPYRGVVIAE